MLNICLFDSQRSILLDQPVLALVLDRHYNVGNLFIYSAQINARNKFG